MRSSLSYLALSKMVMPTGNVDAEDWPQCGYNAVAAGVVVEGHTSYHVSGLTVLT